MSDFYVCVVYYSLPSFPDNCTLIEQHDLIPRDVLLCNKSNDRHIRGGMQYDPNIENGEYRVCEPPVRTNLRRKAENYDSLYLLFRTRFFNQDGSSRYLVTGFYNVEKNFTNECREAPIIHARAMHFVSLADSIDITETMREERAYRCCFTSENIAWHDNLVNWVNQLKHSQNHTNRYIEEISRLKNIFYENEIQGGKYLTCSLCEYRNRPDICSLTWRRRHRAIPHQPANYMRSLDAFYDSIRPNDRAPIT